MWPYFLKPAIGNIPHICFRFAFEVRGSFDLNLQAIISLIHSLATTRSPSSPIATVSPRCLFGVTSSDFELASLTWLSWAVRNFPRFTLHYLANFLFDVCRNFGDIHEKRITSGQPDWSKKKYRPPVDIDSRRSTRIAVTLPAYIEALYFTTGKILSHV